MSLEDLKTYPQLTIFLNTHTMVVVDYMPTVIIISFGLFINNYLKIKGFKVKQHYLVRTLFCTIALLITIPDIYSLYNNFSSSYNLTENASWWATRWLMCYELFYIIEYCDGKIDPNDIFRYLYNLGMLWLSHNYTNEGALYSVYLGLVVCLPELLSSLTMFIWAELDLISIHTFKDTINFINNIYRLFGCAIYISVSLTCTIWISTHKEYTIWNILFVIIRLIESINNPWSLYKEPYEACVRLLHN
jgi:hypothetical protein